MDQEDMAPTERHKEVYSCECVKQFILIQLFLNYCITTTYIIYYV